MEKIERCSKCGDDHTDNQKCRKLSRNERRLLKKNSDKSNPPPEYSLKDATFCPYCGEHPEYEVTKQYYPNDTLDMFFVECSNTLCPIKPRTSWYDTLQKALIAWNTRTIQEEGDAIAHQLGQLCDESQAEVERLHDFVDWILKCWQSAPIQQRKGYLQSIFDAAKALNHNDTCHQPTTSTLDDSNPPTEDSHK